jgi:hypothetical protein
MTVRVFCGRNGAHVAAESKHPQGEVILENSRPFAPFASTSSAFLSVSIRVHPWLKYFPLRVCGELPRPKIHQSTNPLIHFSVQPLAFVFFAFFVVH